MIANVAMVRSHIDGVVTTACDFDMSFGRNWIANNVAWIQIMIKAVQPR